MNTLRTKAQRLRGELNGTHRRRELARLERSIARVERTAGDGPARERLQRQAAVTNMCPVDDWRFSPEALESIFSGVDTVEKGFDATERRRDLRKLSKVDPSPYDEFGGWRENVRVYDVGVKPGARKRTEREGGNGGG